MTSSPDKPTLPKWRMYATAITVPACVLVVWGALYVADTFGVPVEIVQGVVTAKNHYSGTTSYSTNIVGRQAFVQSSESPDAYVVEVKINEESAIGYVMPDQFSLLHEGDAVTIKIRRPRSAKTIEIVEFVESTH